MTPHAARDNTVTVLLPVYNAGAHLMPAIASMLAQTHDRLELLVIDDGSTDGSSQTLDLLADPRVRVIHQTNQGLVGALNNGLAAARTDLVARMDQDDLSTPTRLSQQLEYLLAHPDVAAVGCCYEVMDESGVTTTVAHVAGHPAYLRRQLYFRNVFPHGGMLFRRAAVQSVGGYQEVGPAEDYDLWVRLAAQHELANLPDVLFRYRVTETGMSVQSAELQRQSRQAIRERLHRQRPLVMHAAQVFGEGRLHHLAFGATCVDALRSYVYDHVWLAILLARRRCWRGAFASATGVTALVLRHPWACLKTARGRV